MEFDLCNVMSILLKAIFFAKKQMKIFKSYYKTIKMWINLQFITTCTKIDLKSGYWQMELKRER